MRKAKNYDSASERLWTEHSFSIEWVLVSKPETVIISNSQGS